MLGATGTIGRATVRALVGRGHEVVCFVRPRAGPGGAPAPDDSARLLDGAALRFGDVTDPASLARDGFRGERFDALVSCLASRTGAPRDAWAIDHAAHVAALAAARAAGVAQVVLLSAICVQKPLLAFQHAKLAFEAELVALRPDLVDRAPHRLLQVAVGAGRAGPPRQAVPAVRRRPPHRLQADRRRRPRPLSSPSASTIPPGRTASCRSAGPARPITPREQGEALFALLGRPPRFRHVPVALLDGIIRVLDGLGRLRPALADKAELARIGRYYATESMLVLDQTTGRYDAAATPSTGTDTLFEFYGAAAARRGLSRSRRSRGVLSDDAQAAAMTRVSINTS